MQVEEVGIGVQWCFINTLLDVGAHLTCYIERL